MLKEYTFSQVYYEGDPSLLWPVILRLLQDLMLHLKELGVGLISEDS